MARENSMHESSSGVFFLVLARDSKHVKEKIDDLRKRDTHFVVICGESVNAPNVVYREAKGKWDAVNFGYKFIPEDADIVVLHDADTRFVSSEPAISLIKSGFDFVYSAVKPVGGSQQRFYAIANPLNRALNIFAIGELVAVRKRVLDQLLPIPPVLAEDTYLLFKALELGYRVRFCEDVYLTTVRTLSAVEEVRYKERTTLGILQALDFTSPPVILRIFYLMLPFLALLLFCTGKNGRTWARGMMTGYKAHLRKVNRYSF